jgi:hypothetical protein
MATRPQTLSTVSYDKSPYLVIYDPSPNGANSGFGSPQPPRGILILWISASTLGFRIIYCMWRNDLFN